MSSQKSNIKNFIPLFVVLILSAVFNTIFYINNNALMQNPALYYVPDIPLIFQYILKFLITGGLFSFIYLKFFKEKALAWLKKVADFFKSNYKKIIFIIIAVATTAALAFLSSIFVAYFIQKSKNSLGMYFNPAYFVYFSAAYFIILFFVLLRKQMGEHPERLFLAISLIIGTLFSVSFPMCCIVSWDDETHYKWSLDTSFLSKTTLKTEADEVIIARTNTDICTRENYVITSISLKDNLDNYKELNKLYKNGYVSIKETEYDNKAFQKIGHLPSATGIALGRGLGLPFYFIFVLGRLANVLVYSLVIFLAIRKLKTNKMLLSVVALFPTAMFLASNYSYDYFVTAFFMLGFSYLFSELQQPDKLISTKDLTIMITAFIFACLPKAIYFPLILSVFLLNKNKFPNPKAYNRFRIIVIILTIFVIATFIIPFFGENINSGDKRGGSEVNPRGQIEYILSSPFDYASTVVSFLKQYLSFDNFKSYTTLFAYFQNKFVYAWILVLLFVATFTDRNSYDEVTCKAKPRIFSTILLFITLMLVISSMYISFTPVGTKGINGCQGRYIIPLLFPFLALYGSPKIENKINKSFYNGIIFACCSFILLSSIYKSCLCLYY